MCAASVHLGKQLAGIVAVAREKHVYFPALPAIWGSDALKSWLPVACISGAPGGRCLTIRAPLPPLGESTRAGGVSELGVTARVEPWRMVTSA